MKIAFSSSLTKASLCAFAILAVSLAALAAEAPSAAAIQIEPSKTKVLLLPAIDEVSGTEGRSRLRTQIVRLRQQYQFLSRHFIVLSEVMAVKAAQRDPVLNIESSRERSAEVLDQLAARLGADWVVSLAMQEAGYVDDPAFDGTRFTAQATLKLQVRDAHRHLWLANRNHTTRAMGGGAPPEILLACTWTVADEALLTVLSPYPEVVPVSLDGAIVDYLKGQTEPVLGEPGKEFSGLTTVPTPPSRSP